MIHISIEPKREKSVAVKGLKSLDKGYGFFSYEGVPVVSSRTIGDVFVKEHYHVLRNIDNLIEDSEGGGPPNFEE